MNIKKNNPNPISGDYTFKGDPVVNVEPFMGRLHTINKETAEALESAINSANAIATRLGRGIEGTAREDLSARQSQHEAAERINQAINCRVLAQELELLIQDISERL